MPARQRSRNPKVFYLTCKHCNEHREVGKTNGWLFSHSPEKGTVCHNCSGKPQVRNAALFAGQVAILMSDDSIVFAPVSRFISVRRYLAKSAQ